MSRSGSDGSNTEHGGSQRENPFKKLAKNGPFTDGTLSIFRKIA